MIDEIEPFYPLEQEQLEVLLTHANKERRTNQDKKCLKIWYVWFDILITTFPNILIELQNFVAV